MRASRADYRMGAGSIPRSRLDRGSSNQVARSARRRKGSKPLRSARWYRPVSPSRLIFTLAVEDADLKHPERGSVDALAIGLGARDVNLDGQVGPGVDLVVVRLPGPTPIAGL